MIKILPITAYAVVKRNCPKLSVFDLYDTDKVTTNLEEDIIRVTISPMAKGNQSQKKDVKKPAKKK